MKTSDIHIELKDVCKSYHLANKKIEVLKNINWSIPYGSWVALLGASGSGKTTLLTLLGMLEEPDSGVISCANTDYKTLTRKQRNNFRNQTIGFVFQNYYMLPELTVLENVALPAILNNKAKTNPRTRAAELLTQFGLGDRLHHRPSEMSGGEQQRAAIARALINDPDLLLADEPTGNLDSVTGQEILSLLANIHSTHRRRTIIMITHDSNVAALANNTVTLKNGILCQN